MRAKEPVSRSHSKEVARNSGCAGDQKRCHLWIDIFNNFFYREASRTAFDVLRSAGFNVGVPHRHLCRGRPPYEFGNLDEAEQHQPSIVETPTVPIDVGLPVMLWYRVAHPYVAANSVIYSLKTLAPPACGGRRSFSAGFSNITLPRFNPRSCREKFYYMLTVITKDQ
jgi:hypothetical protein